VIESKNDYEYIMFEDMKAAGFEAVDLRSGYGDNGMGAYMELRDERVSFFVRALARGTHSIDYRLRAEIPGRFSALPAKASAMYAPELKANSDEIKLQIED
jgi:alpha-2-macroglobulin